VRDRRGAAQLDTFALANTLQHSRQGSRWSQRSIMRMQNTEEHNSCMNTLQRAQAASASRYLVRAAAGLSGSKHHRWHHRIRHGAML
jgi:hypothetical protein